MTVGRWVLLALAIGTLFGVFCVAAVARGDTPTRCNAQGACVENISRPVVVSR